MSSFLRVQCRHNSLITDLALSTEGASAMAACITDSQATGYMAMSTGDSRQSTVNSQQRARASAFACAPSCCLATRGIGGIPSSRGACAYATATAAGRWQVSWWRNPFPSQVQLILMCRHPIQFTGHPYNYFSSICASFS